MALRAEIRKEGRARFRMAGMPMAYSLRLMRPWGRMYRRRRPTPMGRRR